MAWLLEKIGKWTTLTGLASVFILFSMVKVHHGPAEDFPPVEASWWETLAGVPVVLMVCLALFGTFIGPLLWLFAGLWGWLRSRK